MSAPESQDKKVPHFSSLKFTPAAQPAESCCADHACSSETAAGDVANGGFTKGMHAASQIGLARIWSVLSWVAE